MPSSSQKSDVASSLSKLSIDSSKKTLAAKNVKEPVADSWEDEDVDDGEEVEEEEEEEEDREAAKPQTDGSKAPPPTPISPSYNTADRSFSPYGAADSSSALGAPPPADGDRIRRPEKTDAVARRMIASALGVKVPRMTEEQRAYDRAVKEKERKRRDEEKAAEKRRLEEAEKAKAAIWED